MLKSITLHGVGPVRDLSARFGQRLNLITGDNGLGKSFLLDVAFWSLTGTWPGGRMAMPDGTIKVPRIRYETRRRATVAPREATYDFRSQTWKRQAGRPMMQGLVIYAAVDGSFAVWDPARNYWQDSRSAAVNAPLPSAFEFRPESLAEREQTGSRPIRRDVANGLEEGGRVLCNGLIADWVEWFYQQRAVHESESLHRVRDPFEILQEVIAALSHPLEPLECEEPQRVYLDDSRKFPALRMPYGTVPYPQWSAGMKRIVKLAYLIVWAWVEHEEAAHLRKQGSADRIILLIDEIEAHLHPKWQRTILPAILGVVDKLANDVAVQVHAVTHSPLVLASAEPHFNEDTDQLFCFNLHSDRTASKMVSFDEVPWAVHGDVVGWLTSDVFGLEQARSREAEDAIETAEAFLRGETANLPASLKSKIAITAELKRVLSGLDPFWPRWIVESK